MPERGNKRNKQPAPNNGSEKKQLELLEKVGNNNLVTYDENTKMYGLRDYHMRKIEIPEKKDVVTLARAFNENFEEKTKQLFANEVEAVKEAMRTGIYVGYRCPEFKHDCIRVAPTSKCFCGHYLHQHEKFIKKKNTFKCLENGCKCPAYQFIPQSPEEVGEYWLRKRHGFKPDEYRSKCKCKHPHDKHDPRIKSCKMCSCGMFNSAFVCAACDRHWEVHQTFFETETERKREGLPTGEDYIPFNEMPELKDIVWDKNGQFLP
ncbi:hypothetical protein SNEBB_009196 [Seison nebaliae]|nr:hypothetical protein SNEBB_009196 [Seison nebaliae]